MCLVVVSCGMKAWHPARALKLADCFVISDQKHLYISYLKNDNDPTTELKLIDTSLQTDFAAYRRHKDRAARMPQNLLSNLIVATMPPICREFHDQASSVI